MPDDGTMVEAVSYTHLDVYKRQPEYWIVDPRDESLSILRLAGDAYAVHGSFNRGETATSAAYPQLAADVSAVLDAP